MIICPKCNFEVSYKMRHSIELNACPSCGEVLLNNIEVKRISSISSKLKGQEFSSKIDSTILSDISFFMYFHIVKPLTLKNADADNDSSDSDSSSEQEQADILDDEKVSADSEDDLKSIREEVEREVLMESQSNILDEEEQESDRISRLKNLAKKQKMSSKNTLRVKRIST